MVGHIYMLTDIRNGKKYIGKHNGKKKYYFSGGILPNRIVKKYGKDIFIKTILEDDIKTEEQLSKKEKKYIKKYNTFVDGYNLTLGGDGGGQWIYKLNDKERENRSQTKREQNLGRIFSEETLKKMSISKKGIKLSEEHRKKLSENSAKTFLGKKHTKETKLKISLKRKGVKNEKHGFFMKKNNPNFQSLSIEGVEYKSFVEAVLKLNLKLGTIKYRVKSKLEKFKNWYKTNKNKKDI